MNHLSIFAAGLRTRFMQLDLRGKIMAALLSAVLLLGAVVTLAAYVAVYYQINSQIQMILESRARLEQREIELPLAGMVALAESIASNTVTANALADSRGREIYLAPLLRNQKLAVAGASLSVVDYRGRPVASSVETAPDYSSDPGFAAMMRSGSPEANLQLLPDRNGAILLALPIRYRLTGNAEGGVMLRIPLTPLLAPSDEMDSRWLKDSAGRIAAGQPPSRKVFEIDRSLQLPAPLDKLSLTLTVARDRADALRAVNLLMVMFLAIGVVVVLSVVTFARAGARFITAPLGEIAAAAEQIAASGRPVARLPDRGSDEFGRLSTAFNTMVDRLAESYAGLENRVAERTRDYEESRHEAERAGNLLREAVSSIAQGFTIYDENDRLVLCNEAYRNFYEASLDLIVPGNSFEEIVRHGAELGQYSEATGRIDEWVRQRVEQHQNANGEVIEQRLADGRWLMVVEHRTPSGYIVGNRIDITELKTATEALRERELYLRATLDNLPFLFWLKDAESRFLAVNRVFANACGRATPEELIGLSDLDVWPQDLAQRYREDDADVMKSGREKTVEEPVAGGSVADWIETYKKPVIAADGTILGTVGFARDISERKRMEQALSESEQRWELAVRGANDGVWDGNVQTKSLYLSERWKSMLGYGIDDLAGNFEEWKALLHPDDTERVVAGLNRHLAGETEFYETEYRLRCRDGGYKWILSRGKALFNDEGIPVRMSGSNTDISERRAAEAHARDRTEQLNVIFALSPDGFVSFDGASCVKYVSPAFTRMTGLEEIDVIGLDEPGFTKSLANACVPEARFAGIAPLRLSRRPPNVSSGSAGHERRQRIEIAGAGKRVVEVGLREARAESVSQILYLRDITHETEVERLKSEFLSTAAHELRTPMASIYGFTELMLAQDFDDAERRDFLATIFRQSELMVSIINELLDLARIEARRGKDFNIARLDLRALVDEILVGFKSPDGRPSPQAAAVDDPLWIRADRKKLTQAIGNVLSNAYKYSPGGASVDVELVVPVQAGSTSDDGGLPMVGVRISDHGIGMTEEQLARVCERFYRADASGKIPGTGLGMSIVKEIVELHGGQLELASTIGSGTAATVWLPAARTEPDHLSPAARPGIHSDSE
jgi:PAS domain S-box-containing protein